MNNLDRGRRLSRLRNMTGLSCKAFASKYHIGYSTLRQWENGRLSGLSSKGAEKIIAAASNEGIACSLQWLLHGTDEPPMILGTTDFNKNIKQPLQNLSPELSTVHDEIIINQEIERFRHAYKQATTMIVPDESMCPFFLQGDYLGGIKYPANKVDAALEQVCIIETTTHELYCRKLKVGNTPNVHNLESLNLNISSGHYLLSNVSIISAAPITRIWRKHRLAIK